ncbi:hypothetical protein [Neisseria shayeganii]|uniref:Prolipoprotein diacylglyceryl transferase n=1 Tax=Neisseria shayeganii 871 TaxID=1032488 RepID=G4CJ41_9NEIS|nr:hypothetical protein [Neisseria shayeganii]EGY52135.1 prolipoprotein diacylglyceryl transferase [Neisseria shayeganii 871]
MLAAFVLGFWCIWLGDREPKVLFEGLFFAILAIVINGFMNWQIPNPDTVWMVHWGVVAAWAALMLFLSDTFGGNLGLRLVIALVAGGGYFWLEQNGCGMAAGWLGESAQQCISGTPAPQPNS